MSPAPPGVFALHLLNVGQGEASLVDLPDNQFALVDGGPRSAADLILKQVELRLRERRVFRFAALTHWDADHIGGLPAVLSKHKPLELVLPNVALNQMEQLCARLEDSEGKLSPLFDELREATRDITPLALGARQEIRDVGRGVEMWALSPAKSVQDRLEEVLKGPSLHRLRSLRNNASLVLWVRAFGKALLLPGEVDGDMASELQQQFGMRGGGLIHHDDDDLRVSWIKLGHHGSKGATDSELLRIFASDAFVASASHGARYGHPHPNVLHAVRSVGGRVMCTRLGKGCHMAQRDPGQFPADDPTWTKDVDWDAEPRRSERCYDTITVTVRPDGHCAVTGAVAERDDCPYGGPSDGRIVLDDGLPHAE